MSKLSICDQGAEWKYPRRRGSSFVTPLLVMDNTCTSLHILTHEQTNIHTRILDAQAHFKNKIQINKKNLVSPHCPMLAEHLSKRE